MNLTQTLKDKYYEPIEEQIINIFYWSIFEPLVEIIKKYNEQINLKGNQLLNAYENDLKVALHSGRVQYKNGIFSGLFNATIGKALRSLGARFISRSGIYKIEESKVPSWVKSEVVIYQMIAKEVHQEIKKTLNYIHDALDQMINKQKLNLNGMSDMIEKDFDSIVKQIEVSPKLNDKSKKELFEDYNENMKLSIKTFSEDMVGELRKSVESNATSGYRFDKLIDVIQNKYDVIKSKAKFLARQETSIFMSKFRKERFKESGCKRYIWSSSHDERVRDSHKKLNGQVCFYDNPPIIDGRPCNPGEDFGCRCIDMPILEPIEV